MSHEASQSKDRHPAFRAMKRTLNNNFIQLENQAFENVLSHDAALKQFEYDTTTLILCKQIAYGERKGEVWRVTVLLDKRVVNPETGMPLKLINLEPLQNTAPNQQSYQYNVADNSVANLIKKDDAECLTPITNGTDIAQISSLCELLQKGDMLEAIDYENPPRRRINLSHIINIPRGEA